MESAVAPSKVSAQSPPCNQKALPSAASAIFSFRLSHSPAKTSGGNFFNDSTALANSFASGHCGCWAATKPGVKIESKFADIIGEF